MGALGYATTGDAICIGAWGQSDQKSAIGPAKMTKPKQGLKQPKITSVKLADITTDTDTFQFREYELNEWHVGELQRYLRPGAGFDPIDLWRHPDTAALVVLNGHHRLEAYRRSGWNGKVPARVHGCSLRDARKVALEDNSKVRLAMSATERQDAAWRLLVMREGAAFLYSKREIVALGLVSDGQVGVMRRTYRQLADLGDGIPETWAEAAGRDTVRGAGGDRDADEWVMARAAELDDKVGKLIGDEFDKCPDAAAQIVASRAGRQGCRVLLDHLDAVAVGDSAEEIGLLAFVLAERLTPDEIDDLALQAKVVANPPF